MVVVQIKLGEQDGFLYEATCATPNDHLVRDLVHVHNARIRLASLNAYVPGLFTHGVAKHPQNQGIDSYATDQVRKEEFYEEDPLGQRTGNGVCPSLRETLGRMVEDVKAYLKSNMREPVLLPALQEKLDNFRGIVMMGFPMGLPEYDIVQMLLDGNDEEALAGLQASQDLMDPATAELWWAGKQFFRDDTVGDRVGKNEKTKVIARLARKSGGAPQREPAVSEDERKAMMAHYFKKQEELKKLADEDEDDYLHSSWANPSALKNQLRGTNNLRPF
ncbi:hypothetical protein SDRG_15351 [Saprolegnia diclina VS20]|uniref:Uncharacterized protein n=1 Tax=Saprolegnia diclina (strain VS20) TaxID=1156394 RepID=T0Q0F0_SAPDV|nr:hypothetical protein SDRG_15351 [Saprolegnia diclina VS20]EQC26840.1 hypothetical protein SDRG_15351 [Saprolegnia diclina VS20]|eukprot:XP_008619742.1 hypothetical protein SDRG_15351 [Saprolegnia diclina VS20]